MSVVRSYIARETLSALDFVAVDESARSAIKCSPAYPHDGVALNPVNAGEFVNVRMEPRLPVEPPSPPPEFSTFRGEYEEGAVYHRGDIVTFHGAEYMSVGSSRNISPPSHCWMAISAAPAYPAGPPWPLGTLAASLAAPYPPHDVGPIVGLNDDLGEPAVQVSNRSFTAANYVEDTPFNLAVLEAARRRLERAFIENQTRHIAESLGIKPAALGVLDSGLKPPPFEFAPPPGQRRFA